MPWERPLSAQRGPAGLQRLESGKGYKGGLFGCDITELLGNLGNLSGNGVFWRARKSVAFPSSLIYHFFFFNQGNILLAGFLEGISLSRAGDWGVGD